MFNSDELDRTQFLPMCNLDVESRTLNLVEYARSNDHKHCVFVGSDRRVCMAAYLQVYAAMPDKEIHHHSQARLHIALNNGTVIYFVSAESPDSLRGCQMHYVCLGPLVRLTDRVYTEVIRASVIGVESYIIAQGMPVDRDPKLIRRT